MLRLALMLALVLMTTSLAGCTAPEPTELRVPQSRSTQRPQATWAIAEWPVAEPMPVYETERSCCSMYRVIRAAEAFGFAPVPSELDWPDYVGFGEEGARLAVGVPDGRFSARWDVGGGAAPDEDEVVDKARPLLEEAGLWPDEGILRPGAPRVSAGQTFGVMQKGSSTVTVMERLVSFPPRMGDLPTIGSASLRMGFAAGGELSRVDVLWPDLDERGKVAILPGEQVPDLYEARHGTIEHDCPTATFTEAELGYYVGAPGWDVPYAFPVWFVRGTCDEGDTVQFVVSAVQGAHD